ncbi:MAG: porin [Aquabacterium sp.]|uniref:porin n=1 Tax=Aquabacterium sp. TaxID=1872578 RepID=UPI00271B38DC|nr:porin [Aquabacterium sp.]MDO9004234.1 porin [Aquabacterium sp.]
MFAKKNLVAAAALMALVGAAQADVKVYGSVEASFGSYEDAHTKGDSTRATKVSSGNMMTSFIGFSGSEDLGGGLKAEFALESFLATDTGSNLPNLASGFWGRGSFVALNGGFGKLALGQYDNPLFTSGYTYNPFGSSMAFSPTMRHLYSGGSIAATPLPGFAAVGFDTGFVNSITYETPNLGGFSAIAQFAPKESTNANAQNSYSVGATYAAGPFGASLTYVKGGQGLNTAYLADQKVIDFGTSYDFGVVKLFGQYTSVKTKSVFYTPATLVTGLDVDAKIYQVGVSVPVTDKGSVLVSYGENKSDVGAALGGGEFKDRVFSLGYDHFLSKRTDVYAVFSNNTQSNTGNDESGQTFAFGIKHAF